MHWIVKLSIDCIGNERIVDGARLVDIDVVHSVDVDSAPRIVREH